ncbi:hypothetical protein [Tepidiforma sp.]|jgi:endonuclease-3 related protein|uniref:endonuclease III domain-containing protein n=1 Tax=Tepidiforma sp. TaxID=2682230 RepID=UPI002620D0AD|nr:hypothetical protein [Tepidiforma sp.]MCX7617174.1 hypothetical protein [Tepidiforma sp.]
MSAGVSGVLAALEAMHGGRPWHWRPGEAPFEVCVGAILVQNTASANAERALDRLRAAGALDAAAMAALGQPELEELIRPAGQFRQKAKKLRAFLELCGEVGGLEPLFALPPAELRPHLLATWGIGPETADCILCYGAGREAVVVDAYTIRLFRRLEMGPESDRYEAWQGWLAAELAGVPGWQGAERLGRAHALIVLHAKHPCRKRAPRCGECLLSGRCAFAAATNGPR